MGKPPNAPILTRTDLQNLEHNIKHGDIVVTTSGSTGRPVMITKPRESFLWCKATNQLELHWRKWDLSGNNIAVSILAKNKNIRVGNVIMRNLAPMKVLQNMLEEIQPTYLYTYPSIIKELDLTKLQLKDIKSVGEPGGTNYSCEEAEGQ